MGINMPAHAFLQILIVQHLFWFHTTKIFFILSTDLFIFTICVCVCVFTDSICTGALNLYRILFIQKIKLIKLPQLQTANECCVLGDVCEQH